MRCGPFEVPVVVTELGQKLPVLFGSYSFYEHLESTVKPLGLHVANTNGGRLCLINKDCAHAGILETDKYSGTFSLDWYGPPSQGIALSAALRQEYTQTGF